jgi:hypothetical protein
MSAPDKIWLLWSVPAPSGRISASRLDHSDEGYPEYIRKDVADAEKAEAVAREREACAQVIHEEHAEIWTQEIMEALAMNGHIDPQTYDGKVEIARLIRDELEVIPAAIRARGNG